MKYGPFSCKAYRVNRNSVTDCSGDRTIVFRERLRRSSTSSVAAFNDLHFINDTSYQQDTFFFFNFDLGAEIETSQKSCMESLL